MHHAVLYKERRGREGEGGREEGEGRGGRGGKRKEGEEETSPFIHIPAVKARDRQQQQQTPRGLFCQYFPPKPPRPLPRQAPRTLPAPYAQRQRNATPSLSLMSTPTSSLTSTVFPQ